MLYRQTLTSTICAMALIGAPLTAATVDTNMVQPENQLEDAGRINTSGEIKRSLCKLTLKYIYLGQNVLFIVRRCGHPELIKPVEPNTFNYKEVFRSTIQQLETSYPEPELNMLLQEAIEALDDPFFKNLYINEALTNGEINEGIIALKHELESEMKGKISEAEEQILNLDTSDPLSTKAKELIEGRIFIIEKQMKWDYTLPLETKSEKNTIIKERYNRLKAKWQELCVEIEEKLDEPKTLERVSFEDITPINRVSELTEQEKTDLTEHLQEEFSDPALSNLLEEVITVIRPPVYPSDDSESGLSGKEKILNFMEFHIKRLRELVKWLPEAEKQLENNETEEEFIAGERQLLMVKANRIRYVLRKELHIYKAHQSKKK
jgi:hypothetical protein